VQRCSVGCSVTQKGSVGQLNRCSYGSTMCVHIRKKVVIRDVAVVTSTSVQGKLSYVEHLQVQEGACGEAQDGTA
jgi:hypothetical protein